MAKSKTPQMQVAVYDMGNNPLPDKLVRDIEAAVANLLKDNPTVAHTVVTG